MLNTRRSSAVTNPRRGAMIVMVCLMLVMIFFFAAVVVDHGYTNVTKARMQSAVDAAVLAGINKLADERRLEGPRAAAVVAEEAIEIAYQLLSDNWPSGVPFNPDRDASVRVGRINASGEFTETAAEDSNAMSVELLTSDGALFFAPVLGITERSVTADAIAAFEDQIREIRIEEPGETAPVLPIAVHVDRWKDTLDGFGSDTFAWNDESEEVYWGNDDLTEQNTFTGEKFDGGHFGTLNLGRESNNMKSLTEQIRHGLSQANLDHYGGSLSLGESGSLKVKGDPGMGGPVFDAGADIIGEARMVPLFSKVEGRGANTTYEIVGFAGVRIVDAQKTGRDKYIKVQPANIQDSSFVTGYSGFQTFGSMQPPKLTR